MSTRKHDIKVQYLYNTSTTPSANIDTNLIETSHGSFIYTPTQLHENYNKLTKIEIINVLSAIVCESKSTQKVLSTKIMRNITIAILLLMQGIEANPGIMYVDQLSGAACTRKLVKTLFWAVFDIFCSFQMFFRYFSSKIKKN